MLYQFMRSVLFELPPESAHDLILRVASLSPSLGKITGMTENQRLSLKVGNLQWTAPIGLAAGLDKNAEALDFFSAQGFGSIECGTITLAPQTGNPRPRLFRYPQENSLRNAMGFPNSGMKSIQPRMRCYHQKSPLGANIGKNKNTSTEESIPELCTLFKGLLKYADYLVINVSSPNTPGLRALQEKTYLRELFLELKKIDSNKDLYLKIAPDLDPEKIRELTHLCADLKLTGIIATNTSIMPERGTGGVSGELLRTKAREVRKIILSERRDLELIAAGGISTFQDVVDLWVDGGKAAQIYTAYIYHGPAVLKKISGNILRFLDLQSLYHLDDFFCLSLDERSFRIRSLNLRSWSC